MSGALREAARRALEGLSAREVLAGEEGTVSRLTVDVEVDGRSELVTLALREGRLVWSSTGGEGPHVRAALRWIAAPAPQEEPGPGVRVNEAAELGMGRLSRPPTEPDGGGAEGAARARLAEALEDVMTVVVRAGIASADSPSVAESVERLRREAPLPTPVGLARWLGRLKAALEGHDVGLAARLLEGAAQLAEDLRRDKPTPEVRRRVFGWMGGTDLGGAVERLSDRVMVEVAREQLAGSERGAIERRYLVDLHDGEVFREERTRTSPIASVGPCPRIVNVGLAEVDDAASPRRVRMMQYAVTLELEREELARIGANAYRSFAALADRYRELLDTHPGQAEPFAVVAPRGFEPGGPVCHDDDGQPLPFARADDPAALDALRRVVPPSGPRWIAGRLTDSDGVLMMVPCSVAVPEGDGMRFVRLR